MPLEKEYKTTTIILVLFGGRNTAPRLPGQVVVLLEGGRGGVGLVAGITPETDR